jgi:26S proteasome regulatory subunit N6
MGMSCHVTVGQEQSVWHHARLPSRTSPVCQPLLVAACTRSTIPIVQSALKDYSKELRDDPVVRRHLDDLFKALLEQNLVRIIAPYSKVEVAHLAKLMMLDAATVERELSQMILDKKIAGALSLSTYCVGCATRQPRSCAICHYSSAWACNNARQGCM